MYLNIGAKLKMIARVTFWVLLAAVEIFGVLMLTRVIPGAWFSLDVAWTLVIMALAPAVLWLLTVFLYAAGHLIENSEIRTDLAVRTAAAQGLIRRESVLPGEDRPSRREAPQAYAGAAPQPYVRQPYGAMPQGRPQPYPPQAYAAPQPRPVPQPPQAPVQPEREAQPEPETPPQAPQRVPYVTPPPAPWDLPKEEPHEENE